MIEKSGHDTRRKCAEYPPNRSKLFRTTETRSTIYLPPIPSLISLLSSKHGQARWQSGYNRVCSMSSTEICSAAAVEDVAVPGAAVTLAIKPGPRSRSRPRSRPMRGSKSTTE
jgi:hypothetical protein